MTRRSRIMSRSSAGIHPPNPTTSQPLDRLRRVSADLRGISNSEMELAGSQSSRRPYLRRLLLMSGRFGQERSKVKEKLSKGAGGPASNTSFDGSRLGWTLVVSPRQNCRRTGRRRRRQKVNVEQRHPATDCRPTLPIFLAYKMYRLVSRARHF